MIVNPQARTVIVIAGPTAVGKTGLAIAVARHFGTSVISADSRQCFQELNIGVGRPSETELGIVPHYFIASHSIQQELTAGDFERYALEKTEAIFQRHGEVVMAGGTGLYLKAFCEGLDQVPLISAFIREEITAAYEQQGISWLQEQVRQADPLFAEQGEMQNPQRMMRALEVARQTGQSILSFQRNSPVQRDFHILKIGLDLPREQLYEQINQRVDLMMDKGLLDEVRSLQPYRKINALRTVGYQELFSYLDGEGSLEEAVNKIKTNTRHYAKRQLTWFRKDPAFSWFDPHDTDKVIDWIETEKGKLTPPQSF